MPSIMPYTHVRLSRVKANRRPKNCCPISFKGVTRSGDDKNCVLPAVLNTEAFNSNSNCTGGIWLGLGEFCVLGAGGRPPIHFTYIISPGNTA